MSVSRLIVFFFFFFQAEDGIRDTSVTGVQTCALPISTASPSPAGTDAVQEQSRPAWMKTPGQPFSNYGQPSLQERGVVRWISANRGVPGNGVSWTPLHDLEGTITPSGLHFARHHTGVPQLPIDH